MKVIKDFAMGAGVVVAALVAFLAPQAVLTVMPVSEGQELLIQ